MKEKTVQILCTGSRYVHGTVGRFSSTTTCVECFRIYAVYAEVFVYCARTSDEGHGNCKKDSPDGVDCLKKINKIILYARAHLGESIAGEGENGTRPPSLP